MRDLLILGLAGGLGTVCRYGISVWTRGRFGDDFPWGTLIVNVAGCLLLGFLVHLVLVNASLPRAVKLALTVGFLGGFTTFSTFSVETIALLEQGAAGRALGYVAGNLVAGVLAAWIGLAVARALLGDPATPEVAPG